MNFPNLIVHLHDTPNHIPRDDLVVVKIVLGVLGSIIFCKDRYFRKLLFAKVKSFQYLIINQQESIISQELIWLMHKMIAL